MAWYISKGWYVKKILFFETEEGRDFNDETIQSPFFFFFFFIIKAKAYDNIPDGRGQALAQLGTLQAFPLLSWHCFRDGPLSSEELG